VVIDTDLSSDDILALAYLVREPEVDVRAVTVSGTGLVHCPMGLQVLTRLLAALQRTDIETSCGRETSFPGGHEFPPEWRAASDDGFGLVLDPVPVPNPPFTAPELLASVASASPGSVTIVALGPLTNLADAIAADPAMPGNVERIVEMGGAVDAAGNVATDPSGVGAPGPAEWNIYADPVAADAVFRSGIPITLVPLDATAAVPLDQAFLDALEPDHAAAGADIAYELISRHGVGMGEYLWDALAAVTAVDESVVTIEPIRLAVVTEEGADSGRTIRSDTGTELRVATAADRAAFETRFLAGLRRGEPRKHPFVLTGTIRLRFDGTSCTSDAADTVKAGEWLVDVSTTEPGWMLAAVMRFHEGFGLDDIANYVATAPDPVVQPPFVDVPAYTQLSDQSSGRLLATLTPGTYAFACLHSLAVDGTDAAVTPGDDVFTVEP